MTDRDILAGIKGFMDPQESVRLYELARMAAPKGPLLEIGSYCGRSAVILGRACQEAGSVLFSIDTHTGSEEQQPGQEYYDPDLYDIRTRGINTLPFFLDTLRKTGLIDWVIPLVCTSETAGRMWQTPLAMVFIDGGHSREAVEQDFFSWSPHILPHGLLVMHDIYLNPAAGGQAPRQVYDVAVASGDFIPLPMTGSLGVLRRI